MMPMILSSRTTLASSSSSEQRATNSRSQTAKMIAWNIGLYASSNGQLMKKSFRGISAATFSRLEVVRVSRSTALLQFSFVQYRPSRVSSAPAGFHYPDLTTQSVDDDLPCRATPNDVVSRLNGLLLRPINTCGSGGTSPLDGPFSVDWHNTSRFRKHVIAPLP